MHATPSVPGSADAPAGPGRPRAFDAERALDRAMEVFWRRGYEGASLTDLTRAMGINRPSLYAAFGDKETLFRAVLDRYDAGPSAYVREALEAPTARGCVERLLRHGADLHTRPDHPPGCLMVSAALACGGPASAVHAELNARRAAAEARIRARLERALADGDLPPGSDPAALARYVVTLIRGMAVQAVGGATRDELEGVIRIALRAWPS